MLSNKKVLDDRDLEAFRLLEIGIRKRLSCFGESQTIVFEILEITQKRDHVAAMAVVYVHSSGLMRVRARFRDGENTSLRKADFRFNRTFAGQIGKSQIEERLESEETCYTVDVIFEALPHFAGWNIVGEPQFFPTQEWCWRHEHKADFFLPAR